jgi:adenylate cyclase
MLLDFVSPVRAVHCALGIQKAMVEAGETQPRERRLRLRIGINVVDMIVGRRELQGHGINVASRLEKMSEADGIIVTAAVHDLVESALAGVTFVDLGRQRFHNMSRPIRIYRVKATDGLHGGAPAARALAVQSAAASLIAVLPLAGPPGDADAGSLVDGIRSELTASLSKMSLPTTRSGLSLPGIEVGDPITSQYHHDADIRYTVSGSLRCSGEWFRAWSRWYRMRPSGRTLSKGRARICSGWRTGSFRACSGASSRCWSARSSYGRWRSRLRS